MNLPTGPDLSGRRFGTLVALRRITIPHRPKNKYRWFCRCDCGREVLVRACRLTGGFTKSCGCARRRGTHGMSRVGESPAYAVWIAMKQRCTNPNNDAYPRYGGRGISICERWGKFENFFADMGERPEGHSIDRIDNNGNYEPSNCRWATLQQQQRNRCNNSLLTAFGETKTIADWADDPRCTVRTCVISARLKYGWSIEKAITKPSRGHRIKRKDALA